MKRKLKNFTLLLVAIMCVGCFTACSNKTDEEKARDEIQSGFEEGLEKDEEIMSEADAYVEDRGALTDKLNEKLPDIADAWEAYMTAGTVDESIEAAKAFNEKYDDALTLAEGGVMTEIEIETAIYNHASEATRIADWKINALETYKEVEGKECNRMIIGFDPESKDYIYYLITDDYISGTVINSDNNVCNINIDYASQFPGDVNYEFVTISKDKLMICVTTSDYNQKYYDVDITGEAAGLITEIEYDFQEYYKTENSDNNIEFVKDVLESFNTYDE